jgi:thioredoxin reductase (NADPH)
MAIDVEKLGPGHRIELYIKTDCPYCAQAQAFYRAKGWPFTTYDAQRDSAKKRTMLELAGGDPTVPAIVIDGKYMQSGWGNPPRG